ncbi:transcriptional regulator, partial [Streptomyces nojiriensis]
IYYRLRPEVIEALAGQFADLAQTARAAAEANLKRSCP